VNTDGNRATDGPSFEEPMDICIEEVLETWCLYNAPFVLHDPDLFTPLIHLIHSLLLRAVQEERRALMQPLLKVSPC
jgi:hypothetical protein